ncbi:MAG: type I DNA topoisomerase [Armatimonadetes bacterium]|nr:type I DNA topoisomerase [Armatimonadota bacterium]
MSKTLVIVESPAKAKTISRFLGKDYKVTASFGHIRDLPEKAADVPANVKGKSWAKLGVNIEGDFEAVYVVTSDKKSRVADLKKEAKDATRLLLATDEDREGESISWHILEVLKPKKGTEIQRIVFHEITPEAINEALANPRDVDESLVRAQETRRILDRLYGFTLSPLLWKKVGKGLSAGRVQSIAVRLVVMRERDRRDFVTAKYSSVTAQLKAGDGQFKSKLRLLDTKSVAIGSNFNDQGELTGKNLYHLESEEAKALAEVLQGSAPWVVSQIEKKPGVENPPVPFMTSTLQQEANRKFGFTARRTMQIAQNLYEGIDIGGGAVGLITYMRTDSLTLAKRAVDQAREVIGSRYGKEYLPAKPPVFKSKAKNAQEAHEAIRPTDLSRTPDSIKSKLTDEQFKLYDLIWKRTLASQMERARVERTRVEIDVKAEKRPCTFTASGKAILFPGFLRVYVEGSDDPEAEIGDKESILPEMKEGQELNCQGVISEDHETSPPARYTEASLVRRLEEEGIGRPSTYASIIGTIQDRGYVRKNGNQLVPTWTAFAVTELLEDHFPNLVDIQFTAEMENRLDDIADDKRDMVAHLKEFYYGTGEDLGIAKKVETRGPEIPFPNMPIGDDIIVRIGRNGPFLQRGEGGTGNTASIPEELAPADLTLEKAQELLDEKARGPEAVGVDPQSGQCVFAKSGRFGPYLEVAQTEAEEEAGEKPRRITLPPDLSPNQISETDLMTLLRYPITVGKHPESGDEIVLAIGRYGAYLQAGEKRANAGEWRASANMTVEQAAEMLASGGAKNARKAPEALKTFGELEGMAGEVKVMSGRYGPYVTDGETNATLPRGTEPDAVTPEMAIDLLKKKKEAGPSKRRSFRRKKK